VTKRAIVFGAGADERVAAEVLARSGWEVTALAESDAGLANIPVTEDPWIAAPLPGGGRLELWRDVARSADAIGKLSARDAAKWPQFCERMARLARLLERIYREPAPEGVDLRFALRVRLLGRQGMEDFLRLAPMSAADLLDDWFENDTLKGVLGAAGVMHLCQGPRSGGTVFNLLHHHVGSPPGVFRPPARQAQPAQRLEKICGFVVREGRAAGVELASGPLSADAVISGLGPQRTLLELVDPGWFDPEFVRAVRNVRSRGVVARVELKLDRAVRSPPLAIAPSLDYLERAYDDAKYGAVSRAPYLEAHFKGDIAEVHMQYVPYQASGDEVADLAANALTAQLDGVKVLERRARLPRDLEREFGWPQGQAYHAELALDQILWMRPVGGWSRYRTPIEGLFLCGPATHPGGAIAGISGELCARSCLSSISA